MRNFFAFAKRMTRYPGALFGALVLAFFSALGMGTAMLAMVPVLQNVVHAASNRDDPKIRDLPILARQLNAEIADRVPRLGLSIPESVIDALPRGAYSAALWIFTGDRKWLGWSLRLVRVGVVVGLVFFGVLLLERIA